MNRRNFIKAGTFFLSAAALTKLSGFGSTKLFAKESIKDFSLELITDNSERAIQLVESLIRENMFNYGIVKYSEYEIQGTQKGDIVFFNDGKLVNYKDSIDDLSQRIRNISNNLNLPKVIENPQKIKFYNQRLSLKANRFLIIHKGTIIEEIQPTIAKTILKINGSIGSLTIQSQDNKLNITESSCRHKTCVKTNSISRSGEYIVCIPNEIVIMAE